MLVSLAYTIDSSLENVIAWHAGYLGKSESPAKLNNGPSFRHCHCRHCELLWGASEGGGGGGGLRIFTLPPLCCLRALLWGGGGGVSWGGVENIHSLTLMLLLVNLVIAK